MMLIGFIGIAYCDTISRRPQSSGVATSEIKRCLSAQSGRVECRPSEPVGVHGVAVAALIGPCSHWIAGYSRVGLVPSHQA